MPRLSTDQIHAASDFLGGDRSQTMRLLRQYNQSLRPDVTSEQRQGVVKEVADVLFESGKVVRSANRDSFRYQVPAEVSKRGAASVRHLLEDNDVQAKLLSDLTHVERRVDLPTLRASITPDMGFWG